MIGELLRQDRKLYHINDLAILWNITNRNTLRTTISRYVRKGILFPVHRGLYSTVPLAEIDPYLIGVSLYHDYCYLSTETVLANSGIISQAVFPITFIGKKPARFVLNGQTYLFRQMKPEFLVNTAGISFQNGVYVASTERAVADMLYFNPYYHFDNRENINWPRVKEIQKGVDY